jgi:sugar phosphate isomerase/epimerase
VNAEALMPRPGARLAFSNIAWDAADDDLVAAVLRGARVAGVELAPGTRWPVVAEATAADALSWRQEWQARGLAVTSMQALLFGRPDLVLFGDGAAREATLAYLEHVIALAASLGAGPLVFGSPANRRIGARDAREAAAIAREAFGRLGRAAAAAGVRLCLEPNPVAYGADFLTTVVETVRFLDDVDEAGLGLHLDCGALAINGEAPADAVARGARWLAHVHASEPMLVPPGSAGAPHVALAQALADVGYGGTIAVEMRKPPDASSPRHVADALDVVRAAYAPCLA